MPFSKHFCCTYVSQDLFISHCGAEQQGVPRKHMVAIARAHCLPDQAELSEEAPARSVPVPIPIPLVVVTSTIISIEVQR